MFYREIVVIEKKKETKGKEKKLYWLAQKTLQRNTTKIHLSN